MPWPNPLAKGPLAFAVEEYLADRTNAMTLHRELTAFIANPTPNFYDVQTWDFFARFGDLAIAAPEGATQVLRHTYEYFGVTRYLGNPPRDFDPAHHYVDAGAAGAGYEEDYILAAFHALSRALEVSFGLPGSPSERPQDLDPWPIEIFWSCGQPETRSWVSWRQNPYDARFGQVTLVFSSHRPAEGRELIASGEAAAVRGRPGGAQHVGSVAGRTRGMQVFRVDPAVAGVVEYELRGDSGIPSEAMQANIRGRL